MNYLFVVAHPDDEVLGAGETIYNLSKKKEFVSVCILSGSVNARTHRPSDEEVIKDTDKWVVEAGALINTGAVIHKCAIIGLGAVVDHDAVVGSFSHVDAGDVVESGAIAVGKVMAGTVVRKKNNGPVNWIGEMPVAEKAWAEEYKKQTGREPSFD